MAPEARFLALTSKYRPRDRKAMIIAAVSKYTAPPVASAYVEYPNAADVPIVMSVSMLAISRRARSAAAFRNGQPAQNWMGSVSPNMVHRAQLEPMNAK